MTSTKHARAVSGTTEGGVTFGGYEIHMGLTTTDRDDEVRPFAALEDGSQDGACRNNVIGTYCTVHWSIRLCALKSSRFRHRPSFPRRQNTRGWPPGSRARAPPRSPGFRVDHV